MKTYPLFGDGAGAVVLAPGSPEQGAGLHAGRRRRRRRSAHAAASAAPRSRSARAARRTGRWYIEMDGRPVFKWAVRVVEDSSREVLDAAGLVARAGRLLALPPGQRANPRRGHRGAWASRASASSCTWTATATRRAASVPIALDETLRTGGIRRGDLLLMSGFGGGLTWGTLAWRW